MILAVMKVEIVFFGSNSLKEKRRMVKSMLSRVRQKYSVAIAEVGCLEIRNAALIGVVCVTTEGRHGHAVLDNTLNYLESIAPEAELTSKSREIFGV
tara:strand:+ start:557 stop:847 length:291 start_codon:yes stop_codon:yes gene_type:complete